MMKVIIKRNAFNRFSVELKNLKLFIRSIQYSHPSTFLHLCNSSPNPLISNKKQIEII